MINLQGLAVIVVASIVAVVLGLVTGHHDSEPGMELGLAYLLVGGAAERYGFRPRLLWIPAWIVGLLMLLYSLWEAVGTAWVLGLVGLGVAGLVLLVRRMGSQQAAALEKASVLLAGGGLGSWRAGCGPTESELAGALVEPVAGHDARLCAHNLRVLDATLDLAGPCLPAESLVRLASYAGALEAGRFPGAPSVPGDLAARAAEALAVLAPDSERPDRHELGTRVAEAAGSEARYDPSDYVVRAGRELSLHEHFPGWSAASPEVREETVRRLAAALAEPDSGVPRLRLVPRSRVTGWFSLLTEDLAFGVEFAGTAPRPLTEEDLRRLGPDPERDVAAAVAALRALGPPPLTEVAPGVWHAAVPGVARAILAPDLLTGFPVRGRLVAAVPHPDLLMLTGDQDLPGLARLAAAVEAYLGHPQFLECGLLVRNGEEWQAARFPEDHPASPHLERLMALLRTVQYNRQHQAPSDPPLARYRVRFQEGRAIPYAVWDAREPALLPEVEEVVVVRDGKAETVRMSSLGAAPAGSTPWPPRRRIGSRL